MQLLHCQRVDVQEVAPAQMFEACQPAILSRAQRAHYRLSWQERLARNARAPTARGPIIKLYGVPDTFATFLGLPTA